MMYALHLFRLASVRCGTNSGILPNLYDNMQCTAAGDLEFRSLQDIGIIIGNVVRILIAISGSLAVIAILAAALYYITSTGDPGRTKRAKEIMINTTAGLIIIILAYSVVTFITHYF